jgi:pimeloyl-ACP methyl ester carboxylesterase
MVAAAAAGFRAIAPDLPGYGLSEPPSDLAQASWEGLTKALLAILDSLAIPKVCLNYLISVMSALRSISVCAD